MSHRGDEQGPPPPNRGGQPQQLPIWVTIVVVLSLTALLAYNIVVIGPEGLPTSYVVGGLLGAYAGLDQYLKARGRGPKEPEDPT